MDDLEVNPLHEAFLSRFRREFEMACKKCYVITIPASETLENCHIDAHFANSHILIPSKLLKMHYNSSQAGNFEDIELDGRQLVCTRAGRARQVVQILAEETAYNSLGRQYKTLLISEPLATATRAPRSIARSLRVILAPLGPRSPSPAAARRRRAHLINSRVLLDHDDCARYLEFVSHELTERLEQDARQLQTNYVILDHYLEHAAARTRHLAESYAPKYELALNSAAGGHVEVCDTIRRSIKLSLETYVVHLVHAKLLAAVQSHCAERERRLARGFEHVLESRLTICGLGAQEDFGDFEPDDELARLARRLPSLRSPLAMVNCLVKLVDLVTDALGRSVKLRRLLGQGPARAGPPQRPLLLNRSASASSSLAAVSASANWAQLGGADAQAPVPICSDDLIASLVFSLPRARPAQLASALKYLELFGFSSTERNMAAYYLATLASSIEHIVHFGQPVAAADRPASEEPICDRVPHESGPRPQEV